MKKYPFVLGALVAISVFAKEPCIGKILGANKRGLSLLINVFDAECFIEKRISIFEVEHKQDSTLLKVLPITNRIEKGKKYKESISGRKKHKTLKVTKTTNIFIKWTRHEIYPLTNFENFLFLKKDNILLIDIPCQDSTEVIWPRNFNVDKPLFQTLRCEIAPADRDFYGD